MYLICCQSVADALGYFLKQCLPPECNDDLSLAFLKELCLIATTVITSDHAANSDVAMNFQPVLEFLQTFVKIHGDVIEKNARSVVQSMMQNSNNSSNNMNNSGGNRTIASSSSNAGREREIGSTLETLLLTSITSIDHWLGSTWSAAQQSQGQGQAAFESKRADSSTQPQQPLILLQQQQQQRNRRRSISSRALPAVFALLKTCAERCPVFLMHLSASSASSASSSSSSSGMMGPSAQPSGGGEMLLLRRAVESAVSSLVEWTEDVAVIKAAIGFLGSAVVLTQSFSDEVRHIAEDVLSRQVRAGLVTGLFIGSCGRLPAALLEDVACLLRRIIVAGPISQLHQDLWSHPLLANGSTEVFFLGGRARTVVVSVFDKCSRGMLTDEQLSMVLHDMWELHQTDSPEPSILAGSDAVARFCRKYT